MTYQWKALYYAFIQFLDQLRKDAMLVLLCIAPVFYGLFFRYGIPYIQNLLIKYLNRSDILPPYYLLMDVFMISLTPLLYCFTSAYVILGEIDDGISKYLAVTPIGKKGYLFTRLGIPTVIAIMISNLITYLFRLTELPFIHIFIMSIITGLIGMIEALLVVSISNNKVEGMAVSKLCGLIFLGLPAPFFLVGKIQYLLFFLPTFWIAKYAMKPQLLYAILSITTALLWNFLLFQKFKKKIM